MIVRRRSGESNDSNESRRSLNSTGRKAADSSIENYCNSKAMVVSTETLEMTPKLKSDRQTRELLREGYTFMRMNHSATLKKVVMDTSEFLKGGESMGRLP